MRLMKSPAKITPFFCLIFAYSDPKPNVDNRASSHSVRAVARDYARGALPLQSAFVIASRIALSGAVSFHFVSPLLRSTPSCRHKASRSTGAGVDFILS